MKDRARKGFGDALKVILRYGESVRIRGHERASRWGLAGPGLCGEMETRLKR